jgi:hypothetical protein
MAALPEWRDDAGVLLAAAVALAGDPGTPGTAVAIQLTNDLAGAGADPISNARILPMFRMVGDTEFVAAGIEVADRRMLQIRISAGVGVTLPAGEWKSVGAGAAFTVPTIADETGVELELRANIPADVVDPLVFEVALALDVATSLPGPDGISDAGGDGIYAGYRDAGQTVHVSGSLTVENPGGADSQVQVSDHVWIASGLAWCYRAGLSTIAASASGKIRSVLLSLAQDGSLTVTSGSEATPPLLVSHRPALPAGELPVSWVSRDDSATIVDADITDARELGFYALSTSSLIATIGPGPRALVDSAVCQNSAAQQVSLDDDSTNSLWLQRDGRIGKSTDGAPSGDRALILYEVDTASGAVTATRDLRQLTGAHVERVAFSWVGEVTVDDWRYATVTCRRPCQLSPLSPVVFSIAAQGDGSGGQTRCELQVRRAGTWTSLFDTAADRPTIAYNAGTSALFDASAVPDAFDLPASAQLRARISEVPSGAATDPSDAVLTVELYQ